MARNDPNKADPNNNPSYRNPKGWRKAKEAIGTRCELGRLMERLEHTGHGCPRAVLAEVIKRFLELSPAQRMSAILGDARVHIGTPGERIDTVTVDGKAYPVVVVSGYPKGADGRPYQCIINYVTGRIDMSEHVAPDAWRDLLARAVKALGKRTAKSADGNAGVWAAVRQLLDQHATHGLDRLADDLQATAVELDYDPGLFLAMALSAASDWDDDDARQARGRLSANAAAQGPQEAAPAETTPTPKPTSRRSLPGESVAAAWKRLAPVGWPLPPNLPANAVVMARTSDVEGMPPTIFAGPDDFKMLCPHCGRGFVHGCVLGKHVVREHGWRRLPKGGIRPPVVVVPHLEQLPAKQRETWDRAFREAFGEAKAAA